MRLTLHKETTGTFLGADTVCSHTRVYPIILGIRSVYNQLGHALFVGHLEKLGRLERKQHLVSKYSFSFIVT